MFHYTTNEDYNSIVRDGFIEPATTGVPFGERPGVWFSSHSVWEPTASKTFQHKETGASHRATWEEMQELGLIRIEVSFQTAAHSWDEFKRLSGASTDTIRTLERRGRALSANPTHWRVSFEPVPCAKWLTVESWAGSEWKALIDPSERVVQIFVRDSRFAFIASTPEEWLKFKQAEVVVFSDSTSESLTVIYGRDRVKHLQDNGTENIEVFSVQINQGSKELEMLAVACKVMKGGYDN